MIRFRDTILEDYFIDPVTAIITNSKGEVQKTSINKDGYAYFKGMAIHKIQVHTHLGYKKGFDIHHIDKNKLNNSLSNLVYLTHSAHMKIHNKGENNVMFGKTGEKHPLYGKHHSEDTKKKMSEVSKGRKHSEEWKKKLSAARKGENNPCYGTKFKWINNGIEQRRCPLDEAIPTGFVCGMLKRKK